MKVFDKSLVKEIVLPKPLSHKGQNGKLMIIGGSHLFHAAFLWALTTASRIVDMVFYSSVIENNQIVQELKKEFRNGIVVPRDKIEEYIKEVDCILIGPGMLRAKTITTEAQEAKTMSQINNLADEGEQSYFLTKYLLEKYPHKKWVIDAGAVQMLNPEWLVPLSGNAVITPHAGEFEKVKANIADNELRKAYVGKSMEEQVEIFSKMFSCVVLLKDKVDIVCSETDCCLIEGGNAGMTKGGTGDVLAGLVAALACKNNPYIASSVGSYINKKAGDSLFSRVSYFFNSSDLVNEIPLVMKACLEPEAGGSS